MSILESNPDLVQALSQEMTPKFLATRTADGLPNIVPCTSIMPAGNTPGKPPSEAILPSDDLLIFGNFLLRKSVVNLDEDPRVGILVITTSLEGWVLQGDFLGWQRAGPYVDQLNSTDLLRYNAYTGIRNAGIVQVNALLAHFRISKLRVLREYLIARVAAATRRATTPADAIVAMPRPVQQRFNSMMAVKVLAFLDDKGVPLVVPALSLQPVGQSTLICAEGLATVLLERLAPGAQVAANILTPDVVSFQAKGQWLGRRPIMGIPVAAMSVASLFAGGPPIPGRQIA